MNHHLAQNKLEIDTRLVTAGAVLTAAGALVACTGMVIAAAAVFAAGLAACSAPWMCLRRRWRP